MALVDTDSSKQQATAFKDVNEVVRVLRGAIADEASATSLYLKIIDSIKLMQVDESLDYSKVIEHLNEIMNEENQHLGKLIALISILTPEAGTEMVKGMQGE